MQIVRVVLSTCLFLTVVANALAQSTDPCNNDELRRAWESDPIYTEAMELARTLENRGFVVEVCAVQSKRHFSKARRVPPGTRPSKASSKFCSCRCRRISRACKSWPNRNRVTATLTFFGERLIFQQRWIVPNPWSLSSTRICCLKCGEMRNSRNNSHMLWKDDSPFCRTSDLVS